MVFFNRIHNNKVLHFSFAELYFHIVCMFNSQVDSIGRIQWSRSDWGDFGQYGIWAVGDNPLCCAHDDGGRPPHCWGSVCPLASQLHPTGSSLDKNLTLHSIDDSYNGSSLGVLLSNFYKSVLPS